MSVLIVSKSGPIADGLQAIVASMPGVRGTYHAPDAPRAVEALAQLRPQLVILDFGLPNRQAAMLLRMMRADCPGTLCIAMAGTVGERKAAEEAGADAALLEGCPAPNLIATLERLLAGLKLGPSPELTQSYCGASRREMLRLTYEEQRRAAVLDDWDRGHTSAAEAATVLGLSPAYVRRLRVKYREKGPRALAHGNRGRRSAHSLDSSVTARVAELARTKYVGLTGKRLAEKLGEEGIKVSRSSVRRILISSGVERTAGWHTKSN